MYTRREGEYTHRNLSFVWAAMSRLENWREPPLTSRACAGSHVGRCAVDIAKRRRGDGEEQRARRTCGVLDLDLDHDVNHLAQP
jgi:hypothetical protein